MCVSTLLYIIHTAARTTFMYSYVAIQALNFVIFMQVIMLLVLLLSSVLAIGSGTIHIVTPEDDLSGINEFFTSNTQLFFLPGVYHLYNETVILNVHNISLIGNDATLMVHWGVNITIINCSMVTFKNFVTTTTHNMIIFNKSPSILYFKNSYCVSIHNIVIMVMKIKVQNVMGESVLSNITSHRIEIHYDDSISMESESIHKLIIYGSTIKNESCDIVVEQVSYGVAIIITDSMFAELASS